MPAIEQSLPICIVLSAVGGAIEVLATAILAHREANERITGQQWSRLARLFSLASNVALQLMSSIIGNLIATWYGPISIVGPMFLSSQLLTNMMVFGFWLGLENFNKDMRVGTYVVVSAVVLLPSVGPTAQDDQNAQELLSLLSTRIWSGANVVVMFVAALGLLAFDMSSLRETYRMGLLLVIRSTAFTVNLTVSKLVVMDIDPMALIVCIILKMASGAIITFALVIQSTTVSQAKFAPLNASALILVNAITGMLLWQDWLVLKSWAGYGVVFVQLVLGNYLLLGDVDLLSPENPRYGREELLRETGLLKRNNAVRNLQTQLRDSISANSYEMFSGEIQMNEERPRPRPRPRPSLHQTVAIWSSVYFEDSTDISLTRRKSRRSKSIFAIDSDNAEGQGELC